MAKVHPDIAAIVREFQPGFRLGPINGSGHREIHGKDGKCVRTANGQKVTLPMTPKVGGPHAMKRMRSHLMAVGVLPKPEELAVMETVKPIRRYTPPPTFSDVPPALREWAERVGANNGNGHRPKMPEVVANISYEEYLAMEEAVALVMQKGPRAVKKYLPFVKFTQRVKAHLERRMEELETQATNGSLSSHV